jgi:methyl-accepting chemotaxis protein
LKELSFKDWSFPLKIMAGYLTGIMLLTVLFAMSIRHMGTIGSDYNNLMNDSWRQLDALQTMNSAMMEVRLSLPEKPAQAQVALARVEYTLQHYLTLKKGSLPDDLVVLVAELYNFRQKVLEELAGGIAPADLNRSFLSLSGRLRFEVERARGKTQVAEASYLERINQLLLLNIILAPLSFLFLYYYGFMLTNITGLRLRRFVANLQMINNGRTNVRIKDDSRDELGQIAAGVNQLAEKIEKGYNTPL